MSGLLAASPADGRAALKIKGSAFTKGVEVLSAAGRNRFPDGSKVECEGKLGTVFATVHTEAGGLCQVVFDEGGCVAQPESNLTLPAKSMHKAQASSVGYGSVPGQDEDEEEWSAVPVKDQFIGSFANAMLGEQEQDKAGNTRRSWNWLNTLLIFIPLAFVANFCNLSDGCIFVTSFLAIIPLAGMLGEFTDDLCGHVGPALGALINASMGNATELIVCIFAIRQGLFDVIKNSMLGSVIGNMLLVLGCSFLARSVQNGTTQRQIELARAPLWWFNGDAANIMGGLLLLSCLSLAIPTAFAQLQIGTGAPVAPGHIPAHHAPSDAAVFGASRISAIFIIFGYVIYLSFQVRHSKVFDAQEEKGGGDGDGEKGDGDGEEEDEPNYSMGFDVGMLAGCTIFIAFLSEYLVDALQPATVELGLSEAWVAVILLPIIGNAAEHATSVMAAYKGDMEISLGVAIGSSIQIAGFLVPALVIASWAFNGTSPEPLQGKDGAPMVCGNRLCPGGLDMNFHPFSMTCMILSVIVVNKITGDGRGSYLEGVCLLLAYCVIAGAFWFVPPNSNA